MGTNLFNPADHRNYPSRWPAYRGKRLFHEIDDRSQYGTEELLSVSHITGITPRSQKNVTMFKSESLVGYKRCLVGDIAANTMWMWQGAIGVSRFEGVVSPSYNVYRQNADYYNPRFLDLLLREHKLIDVYHSLSTGIRPSRLRLYPEEFLTIDFPVPPRAEQDQIVRYLDWKISEFNKLINIKKDEIDKLNEGKLVLITNTVTHGMNNGEQFKDSNNKWIGEVPVVWDVTTVGKVYKLILGKMLAPQKLDNNESLEAYFCAKDIHFGGIDKTNLKKMWFKPEEIKQYQVQEGDLLIVEGGAGAGGTALAKISSGERIMIQNSVHLVRPNKNYSTNEYLYYWMYSIVKRGYIEYCANVATIPHFTKEKLSITPLPLPSVKEQKSIVDFLNKDCLKIDAVIDAYQEQIKLLKECKSRLISDAVTGQIDVRDIEIPEYEYVEETADIDSEEMTVFDETENEEV